MYVYMIACTHVCTYVRTHVRLQVVFQAVCLSEREVWRVHGAAAGPPEWQSVGHNVDDIILHCLNDPRLWELWYIPSLLWVIQHLHHQPYHHGEEDEDSKNFKEVHET